MILKYPKLDRIIKQIMNNKLAISNNYTTATNHKYS
jgi:hypothetical protein